MTGAPQSSASAAPGIILGGLAVAVWIAWAWLEGGHPPWATNSLGLAVVGLLGLASLLVGFGRHASEPLRLTMSGMLVAFVAWNFLSILWADDPGDAWAAANKTAVYVATFALFALWPMTTRVLTTILSAFSLVVAATAVVVLARAALDDDPGRFFVDDRLLAPIGYVNANVALWTVGLWPALHLGARRDVRPVLRALFLAAATILVGTAVLGQSRAWLVVLPLASVAYVALQRQRLRAVLAIALTSGASLIAMRALLSVYDEGVADETFAAQLDDAVVLCAVSAATAGLAGLGWGLLDSRITITREVARALGVGVCALLIAVAAVGTAGAASRVDDPRAWAEDHWRDFTCSYCPDESAESRFTGTLSSDRYRAWSIAWHEFRQHPVTGIGADNFATPYLRHRTDPYFNPRYPHSLPLRVLSQLGVVGFLLLVGGVAIALALALRARARLEPAAAGAVGAAVTVFLYWTLHGSGDWFWEIPAIAAPAFGLLGAASAVTGPETASSGLGAGGRRARAIVVIMLAALVGSLAVTWIAASLERAAARTWVATPEASYTRLDLAARLDGLSADPLLLKGSIALKRHDWAVAEAALLEAAEREPENWYVQLQLGVLAGATGAFERADQRLVEARRLNPLDPIAAIAQRLVTRRVRLDPDSIDRLFLVEAEKLFDRPVFEHHRAR